MKLVGLVYTLQPILLVALLIAAVGSFRAFPDPRAEDSLGSGTVLRVGGHGQVPHEYPGRSLGLTNPYIDRPGRLETVEACLSETII